MAATGKLIQQVMVEHKFPFCVCVRVKFLFSFSQLDSGDPNFVGNIQSISQEPAEHMPSSLHWV